MAKTPNKPPSAIKEERLRQSIQAAGPEILKQVLESDPQTSKIVAVSASKYFSGPIPSPECLQQYKAIDPSLVSRILDHAEREQLKRFEMDEKSFNVSEKIATRGQRYALISTGLGLVAATILGVMSPFPGSAYAAAAIGVGSLGMPIAKGFLDWLKSAR